MHHNQSQKPEYVLKRANDLINTSTNGTGEEKRWALELLHNYIGGKKKSSQWSKLNEAIMKRHVELCIDLKNHHFAKDGLHQYRNMCQVADPASLETVILHLLDLSEAETVAARSRVLEGASLITDLDQEESPESIMLSTMTEEGDKERTTREAVVPWLKFLWETYRAVLELLHKMPKLEKVYHKTCEKAFKFCQDYERKIEFKRLCEMLRLHLALLQKTASAAPAPTRANRANWEWTNESVDLHLQTRFLQLETATALELWNEAYRTVEDIYSIMLAGRKSTRPKLMSVYYEKLTRIFWVSENYLFHAYAWFRYYSLVVEFKRDFKGDERAILASCVLLSALSVPSLRDAETATGNVASADDEDTANEKQQQMATLLDFQANPSRKALLADVFAKGIIADVLPDLANLYDDIESRFQPLTLVKNITKALATVKSIPQLAVYAVPLQRVAVFKVVQQLSKVYDVVKLSFLRKLMEGLVDVTPAQVERLMIDGVMRKQLSLRIDHISQCVRFGASIVNEAAIVENQVQVFGTKLQTAGRLIASQNQTPESERTKAAARRDFIALVRAAADKEHTLALERKNTIEQRKIEVERVQEERERIAVLIAEAEAAKVAAEEKARQDKERAIREAEKAKVEQEKDECRKLKRELDKHGVKYEEADLLAMSPEKRNGLLAQAIQDALKAKEEQARKLTEQAKRLDHITRALCIESAAVIKQREAAQAERDAEKYRASCVEFIAKSKELHEKELLEKKRWSPLQIHKAAFDAIISNAQRKSYNAEFEHLKHRALAEHRARKVASARQKWDEEMQRLEEEEELARDREERERLEREQYEMTRREREEREELERAAAREKELQARSLEAVRQQRLAEQKAKLQAPAPAPAPAAPASSWSRGTASTADDSRPSAFGSRSGDRAERSDRGGDFERGAAPERPSRGFGDRSGFGDRADRSGASERPERAGFGERADRGGFGERSGFGDRSDRGGFGEKADRSGFGERSDRGGFERGGGADKPKDSGSSWARGGATSGAAAPPREMDRDRRPADNDKWSTVGSRGERKPESGDKWARGPAKK